MATYRKKCVLGCDDLQAYFHRFPNPRLRSEDYAVWVSATNNKLIGLDPMKVYNSIRICDYHFRPQDKTYGHRLSICAVPVLYLQGVFKNEVIITENEHNYCHPRMLGYSTDKVSSSHSLDVSVKVHNGMGRSSDIPLVDALKGKSL